MDGISNRYDPKEAEPKWRDRWQAQDLFAAKLSPTSFVIDTPPPTVSGRMHIGHAFSYTQQDIYARYQRMKRGDVFFPFGTDDNGLPTERLVEKMQNVKGSRMSRQEFRDLCYKTVQELLPEFIGDWKSIGMSCDFNATYSTIDAMSQATSQASFVDLWGKGRVYRKEAPVAWCVQCQTAIAQAEFESVELASAFSDIAFKGPSGEPLTIATTRPELIPACVALAVNPADARYAHLHGKHATVPLSDHPVPIIADEKVEMEKGTGLMMVCTFGDKEDVDKWHRHGLPLRIIIGRDGRLNELAGKYQGLTIKDARKAVLDDLKTCGLLLGQKQILHALNAHERCGTEVEILKTPQWYVRVMDMKEELLEAGRKIRWHPEHMRVRYEHWVENLNWDWCVSRQRFFGVPFPAWHNAKTGEIVIARKQDLPIDPTARMPPHLSEAQCADLVPDTDVMDTWATSSSSPQIILGLLKHPENASFLPTALRPQAHEIIRTWAFYTIVKSLLNDGRIPWRDIALSGFVTDPHGQKMSKSKGNVVAPQDVIAKYSADAIRSWAAGVRLGEDIPYLEKELQAGQKTVTKLWNASRFALMNLQDYDGYDARFEDLEVMDRWLLSRYARLVKRCSDGFDAWEHHRVKADLEQFFWSDLCDNYLEIAKGRLYDPKDLLQKRSAQFALSHVLLGVLKLYAPILPFVTEEIYHLRFAAREGKASIHVSSWPEPPATWVDPGADAVGDEIVRIVAAVRKHKSDRQLSMAAPLASLHVTSAHDIRLAEADLLSTTRAATLTRGQGEFGVRIE